MSERELKLFDFQEEIVEDNSKNILLNFSRYLSKTFTMAQKVMKDKPKNAYFLGDANFFKVFMEEVKGVKISRINYEDFRIDDINNKNIDLLICDNINFKKINIGDLNKLKCKCLCSITMNINDLNDNYDLNHWKVYNKGVTTGLKHKLYPIDIIYKEKVGYPACFKRDYDILNEDKNINNIRIHELIEKLLVEYGEIPMNSNTTIYREKVLNQIQMLNDIYKNIK